ncbi:LysR family transcriptional regulator [Vreelandella sp. EE22]
MIRELRTFSCVAQEGTFAGAADKIGLTQAAVSAQMKRLEAELGVALFVRQGRSAVLTPRGRQVLEQTHTLLGLYKSLGDTSTDLLASTPVNIGAIASIQRSLLPNALARFHHAYPSCRTRVLPGLSMALVNQVDAGELDMAAIIRPSFSLHSDLHWTPLAHEPFRLIVPARVEGDDWRELLHRHAFIRYDRSSFGGRQIDRFLTGHHCQVREICEVDELETIIQLVAHGIGVALVPQVANLQPWPTQVRALDLGVQTFHREVGLVCRDNGQLSEPAQALARMIKEESYA